MTMTRRRRRRGGGDLWLQYNMMYMDVYGITARVGKSGKGADNIVGLWSLQGSFGLH
jgi:hypothetical protein